MSRVLFVNRFAPPDPSPTARLLGDLAEHLAQRGAEVTVLASRIRYDDPNTRLSAAETRSGVRIRRVATTRFGRHRLIGRAIDYASFYATALVAMLGELRRGDVLVAKTDPPLLCVPAAFAYRLRGARLVTWNQDLFPEVAAALGLRWTGGPIGRLLRGLRNRALRRAEANIVLSRGMAEHLAREGVPGDRLVILPNWPNREIRPVPAAANPLRHRLGFGEDCVIGYSGNLGRAHLAEHVIRLVLETADLPGVRWLFVGGGPGMELLRAEVMRQGLPNVTFLPYQPRERLAASLSVPDLHLVSQDPACEGLLVPSKLYGVMAAGRPVLFLGANEGEIARDIRRWGIGYCLDVARPEGWRAELEEILRARDRLVGMGERAQRICARRFAPEHALTRWEELLTGRPGTVCATEAELVA